MHTRYDVVVIGGGAAGLSAAAAARGAGASVLLIERERLGGECTWTGCIPSKALIAHAARVHAARSIGAAVDVDFPAVMAAVTAVVEQVAQDESQPVLERYGIAVAHGHARLVSPTEIDVDGTQVVADRTIIATGTSPAMPSFDGAGDVGVLTNETIFSLTQLPARLAVLGGGPVGLELAQAFARLGSQVTLLESGDRIAAHDEPEVADVLTAVLEHEDIQIQTHAVVTRGERRADGIHLATADGQRLVVDAVLAAAGRHSRTDDLGLERAGVALDHAGHVVTDDRLRTTARTVYAVGDVTGRLPFTHAADEMGRIAVANALSRLPRRRWSGRAVPWATFTDPEVGRVGATEREAFTQHGRDARVAFLPLAVTDRARAEGATAGFVKLIAAPRRVLRGIGGGELVGATVVSPSGADVIQEAAFAMKTRALTGRLAQTVHAYPSWSIALRQAAAQFFTTTAHGRACPASDR